MDMICVSAVPIIMVICYLIAEAIKIIAGGKGKIIELLPIISAFLGGGIGVVIFLISPTLLPAGNYLEAFAVGVFSGLCATGSNQIIKQLQKLIKKK